MQLGVGLVLTYFDPALPEVSDKDIVCATRGGIELNITPSYVDTGENVYMMPPETAEMMKIEGWEVTAEFTSVSSSATLFNLALGAADGSVPRMDLQEDDFRDLWWVGDRLDGGLVAIRLINALSDEGVSFTAEDNTAGGTDIHILAHSSFEMDGAIPVEIYAQEGHPMFSIFLHRILRVSNVENQDTFTVDTSTGHLIIDVTGEWSYNVLTDKGRMEVSK